MRAYLRQQRANHEEFLEVFRILNGGGNEDVDVNNSTSEEPLLFRGKNLMEVYAGPGCSQFGRDLVKVMFGEEKDSYIMYYLIGKVRNRKGSRESCSEKIRKLFEGKFLITVCLTGFFSNFSIRF